MVDEELAVMGVAAFGNEALGAGGRLTAADERAMDLS
jgi:hypothetical protein